MDEKLLQAARIRAVKEGTSFNEICRKALENYARASSSPRVQRFDALMARLDAEQHGKPLPSHWKSHDAMYEELLGRGVKR